MHAFVVIPCLNERLTIGITVRSVGFGASIPPPRDATLVIVDNGSTDGTLQELEKLVAAGPPGRILIGHEAEKGYVPPRRRGIDIATAACSQASIALDSALILQCDADTKYDPGYISAFSSMASTSSGNILFEGLTHPPSRFLRDHPGFVRLAESVDREIEVLGGNEKIDVIVDDKVSGFSLESYLKWGGHRREYTATGDEIHAETTRLFIRAVGQGGKRQWVPDAIATPSRRKILRNPLRQFACGGFPRSTAWWKAWNAKHKLRNDLVSFEGDAANETLCPAIAARKAHALGLFALLPAIVIPSQNMAGATIENELVAEALSRFRGNAINVAELFDFVFSTIDLWSYDGRLFLRGRNTKV